MRVVERARERITVAAAEDALLTSLATPFPTQWNDKKLARKSCGQHP